MIHKLYSLVDTKEKAKEPLYIRGVKKREGNSILMYEGEVLNFTTYFNSLSLKKWKRYTTIKKLQLVLQLEGYFRVIFHLYDENGNIRDISMETEVSCFAHSFAIEELDGVLLGFSLQCISDAGIYIEGHWDGEFTEWEAKKIGVSITTFKREKYVKRTMSLLRDFQQNHPWLSVLVIDNGSTLEELNGQQLRVIHNRNFGGSGGFTRGMIEYVEQGMVDYVLLMDDDIVLETSALERTYSMLSGLKIQYEDSFLSGAMLSLEKPCIQYENTARWGKIRLQGEGKNLNLVKVNNLVQNENIPPQKNRYGAWWYCAIPVHRIKDIGYPLPIFVKGDDMEYGIRNHREVMSMNGIGVWHQALQSKMSPIIKYYADRNMLIINNYAEGCNYLTFIVAVVGRVLRRLSEGKLLGIRYMSQALIDYSKGLTGLTAVSSEEKMAQISKIKDEPVSLFAFFGLLINLVKTLISYNNSHEDYINFRTDMLHSSRFWSTFLGLRGKNE